MDDMQPPVYTSYPRGVGSGEAEKLMKLYQAYRGAYFLILSTLCFGLGLNLLLVALFGSKNAIVLPILVCGLLVANFAVSFWVARGIGEAKDKSMGYVVGVALLATLVSPCCIGLVGAGVLQQIASNEIKRYGIRPGMMGIKKADIDARVAELQHVQQTPPPTNTW